MMKILTDIFPRLIRRILKLFKIVSNSPMQAINSFTSLRIQKNNFEQLGYNRNSSMIVFFIPGIQRVTGGVLQIFTLNRLTRDYYKNTGTISLLSWLPAQGKAFHKFEGFNNDETVFPIEMLLQHCESNCKILFHVPEFYTKQFFHYFGDDRLKKLRLENKLRINILNQNIDVMVQPSYIKKLKEVFPDITITAGNPAWASEAEKERLDSPIYPVPTWYYPDNAPRQFYESKKNLLIVSPDSHPDRDVVLDIIRNGLPELEVVVIKDLKYEQYLQYEKSAKWSLTFGEGMDGYFYGPVLRGAIAFAVRNGTFDHPGMSTLKTIYDDYESMALSIVNNMQELDIKDKYEDYNDLVRVPVSKVFDREKTVTGLLSFYNKIEF